MISAKILVAVGELTEKQRKIRAEILDGLIVDSSGKAQISLGPTVVCRRQTILKAFSCAIFLWRRDSLTLLVRALPSCWEISLFPELR